MLSTLHIFNPENDLALANNNENYQPPASAGQMKEDLSTLPAWWAEAGDGILVSSIAEAQQWQSGLEGLLPDVEWCSLRQAPNALRVLPWGWNPALRKQLQLWGMAAESLPSPSEINRYRTLSSRLSAVRMLPRLCLSDRFCGESCFCTTETEIETALHRSAETILKAPYSSSGKGLRFGQGTYDPALANWCRRILKGQEGVVVEPLYQKVTDFAMEFQATAEKVHFVGYSLFRTNANGAYEGNLLLPDEQIAGRLCQWIERDTLHQLKAACLEELAVWLQGSGYQGYIGMDMMICRFDEPPFYRIHPCVEINMRMNMGVVASLLRNRYLAAGAKGIFRIDYYSDNTPLQEVHRRLTAAHPLHIEKNRICSGYLSLAPVTRHARYHAYFIVE